MPKMTPLERAARVLCELDGNPPGATMDGKPLWMDYLPEVRAVVAAIRDPGNDVYQVGFDAEATANPHKTQPHHVVPAVWEAMIDALVKEVDPPRNPEEAS